MSRDPMTRSEAAVPGIPGGRCGAFGALVLGLAALAYATPAAAQFSAQPVILELRTADSASTTTFSVRNEGEAPLQLRIYAGDFDQPADGGHVFMEPGTHPRSCVERLRFFPDDIQLDPMQAGEVRVRMEPGDSTCWSMVFVQSVSRAETGIQIAQRIGIKVYGFSHRLVPQGEIRGVTVARGARSWPLTPADLGGNRQLRAREWFRELDFEYLGARVEFPGGPYRLSETPVEISRPPRLGEHTEEILTQMTEASR